MLKKNRKPPLVKFVPIEVTFQDISVLLKKFFLLVFGLAFVLTILSVAVPSFGEYLDLINPSLRLTAKNAALFCAGALVTWWFIKTLSDYLKPSDTYSQGLVPESDFSAENMLKRLADTEGQIKELQDSSINQPKELQTLTEEDRKALFSKIEDKIERSSIEVYKNELFVLLKQDLELKSNDVHFMQTSKRLDSEIKNQARRGNVNLILGIFISILGVGLLGYFVFDVQNIKTGLDFVSYFVPKFSLVILIEVFAYFFLRLYKKSLDEIKYFQNELTNAENIYLGVKVAGQKENKDLIKLAVEKLVGTERNFVLEKGQSTVELEKERLSVESNNQLAGVLKTAVEKIK